MASNDRVHASREPEVHGDHQGDHRRALELLLDAQRRSTWQAPRGRNPVNATIRWWLGDLLEEMGRSAEAVRYFESLPKSPPAAYRRARLYERLADTPRAREAYELFALAWKDADAELQPRVEEAKAAARRLGSGSRRP